MPIDYSSGQSIRTAPKPYHVTDSRGGCPGANGSGVQLTLTFTTAGTAYVYAEGSMISNTSGRRDLQMTVDGSNVAIQCIQNTGPAATWDDRGNIWCGTVGAGTHTVALTSSYANIWGCGGEWGRMSALVWEVS
jgi:hypothetical protein